jgi:hypothetical protein
MKPHRNAIAALLLMSASLADAAPQTETKLSGESYSFEYSYPPIVTQFPAMQKHVEDIKEAQLEQLKGWAVDWVKDSPERAKEIDLETISDWKLVTNMPAYLSLTFDSWSYTGGVHGNWGRSSMVWDKKASQSMEPIDMFTSRTAFDKLVQTPYCDKLDIERSKKRDGEKVDRSQADDWMQACPKPSELVVILGSSNGKAFNRLAIYAAPYAVGPYSEGDYEIDLPITPQLLAAVKPAYRSSFALTPVKSGKRR